jgi:hypothetical protein
VIGVGLPNRVLRGLVIIIGAGVGIVALAGLGVQAVRGNDTVSSQHQAVIMHDAAVDNAFYRCLDVQTRSLVSPGEPVWLVAGSFGDLVTLIKAVGSWVTIADRLSSAQATVGLRDNVAGGQTCLGTVVVAKNTNPHHGGDGVRVGSGASVPGSGPPPAPPL